MYQDPTFPSPFSEEPALAGSSASAAQQPESPFVGSNTPSVGATGAAQINYENPVETAEDENAGVRRNTCITVFVIALILALIGGGAWYYFYKYKNKTAAPQSEKTSNLISAAIGGRIALPNGAAVIIPQGALPKDTVIKIEKVENGPVTDLYHLTPDGYEFLKPVTVVVPYKESGLGKNETPYDILLDYWFASRRSARDLNYMVDQDGKTLQTQIMKF